MIGLDGGTDQRGRLDEEVAIFAQAPDDEAAVAFDKLFLVVRPRLVRHFRRSRLAEDDCSDLVQTVTDRVWSSRRSFEPNGFAAWWGFVLRIASNCATDLFRQKGRRAEDTLINVGEIPDHDRDYLDILLRDDIFDAADALWLGLPRRQRKQNRDRLLAAQLFYLHGLEWRDIAQMLGKDARTVSDELDEWLLDGAVLRHLAYVELYWSNDKLAGYLLRPNKPLEPLELDQLNEALLRDEFSAGVSDWTAREAFIVLRRIRNGLTTDRIMAFHRYNFDRSEVEGVAERARGRFPIPQAGKRLRAAYEPKGQAERLTESGLWRRLVFQYEFCDDLPQKQIFERTGPAADVVDAKMTSVMLNGWISMNRLLAQLAAYMSEVPA
ncbi:MAG TPA: sigma-70 family RNA polymerase sigma factor [Fimbriimonadaceae bacterium]|nr:sigma-70 family RNA polymerase sigma factor [Fimbriimonadaceae bacterium]